MITIFSEGRNREIKIGLVKKADEILKSRPVVTLFSYIISKMILSLRLIKRFIRGRVDILFAMDMSVANVSQPLHWVKKFTTLHAVFGTPSKALIDQGKIIPHTHIHKYFIREERKALEKSNFNLAGEEHLLHIMSITKKPAAILPTHAGIDINFFYPGKPKKNKYALGTKTGLAKKTILFTGRLAPQKGVKYAILAMEKLPTNYKLVVIGEGPEENNLKNLTRENRLEDRVLFLGPIPHTEIPEHIRSADCVVFTSIKLHGLTEIISQTPLEAMACGIPVVAFDILPSNSSIRPILCSDKNSLLVEERNITSLANAVRRVCEDNTLRENLIRNGLKEIRENGWSHRDVAQYFTHKNLKK